MTSGHFFCSFCNDVVNLRFTGEESEQCPVCRHHSAQWVPHVRRRSGRVALDPERGKMLFQQIKEALPNTLPGYEKFRIN